MQEQHGSWRRINKKFDSTPVSEPVFSLGFRHRSDDAPSNFGVAILPAISVADTTSVSANPKWKILNHDNTCHAVEFAKDHWMAAVFEPTSFRAHDGAAVSVSCPCLFIFQDGSITVSKPMEMADTVVIAIEGYEPQTVRMQVGRRPRKIQLN